MVQQIDIYRTAWIMIDTHGDLACIEAAKREDQLLAEGDIDGVAVWKRINIAIKELENTDLPDKPSLIN
ncbi:MAG: hypothetical protein ABJN26_06205 [Stappiaceae bacterium]